MGRKKEGPKMGGWELQSQKSRKFVRDRGAPFSDMDGFVKAESRGRRMDLYLEELKERERLVEIQEEMYRNPVPLANIEQSGETKRPIGEARVESAPMEPIKGSLEFGQGPKKDPRVKTSFVNQIVAFLRRPLSYITERGAK